MARKVQIRVNFFADSRFLTRLLEAIEKDPYMNNADRQKAIYHAKELSLILLRQDGTLRKSGT